MRRGQLEFCLRSGIYSAAKHKTMSIISVVIIASCLMLVSLLSAVSENVTYNMNMMQDDNVMLAFVDDTCEDEDAELIIADILKIPGVYAAQFVSNEEVYENYIEENGDDYHITPAVFRSRYEIELASGYKASAVADEVLELDYIAEVRVDDSVVEGFAMVKKAISFLLMFLIVSMVTVSIVIIVNTIKLAVHARQREMYIESIVGAYDSFIAGPFIVEGCVLGLIGAMVGFLLFCVIYQCIMVAVSDLVVQEIMDFVSLSSMIVKVLLRNILFGVGIGAVGSLIVTYHTLRRGVMAS
jgi:cell division transport system permease protein